MTGQGLPDPPVNVRAVTPDGTEIPLECRYVGWVDGVHRWEAVISVGVPVDGVRMDVLPAHTEVGVVFGGTG